MTLKDATKDKETDVQIQRDGPRTGDSPRLYCGPGAEERGQRRGPLSMPGCGRSLDLDSPQSGQLALQASDSKGPKGLIVHYK